MTLNIYTKLKTEQLMDKYELVSTDLSTLHDDLAVLLADLHQHYLEVFSGSAGKSVAEKNREADYMTRSEYAEVLKLRGKINYNTSVQNMLANLINWKVNTVRPHLAEFEYPPNSDSERIGNGR